MLTRLASALSGKTTPMIYCEPACPCGKTEVCKVINYQYQCYCKDMDPKW